MHFCVLLYFVFFIIVHTLMVFVTGSAGEPQPHHHRPNTAAWTGLWLYVGVDDRRRGRLACRLTTDPAVSAHGAEDRAEALSGGRSGSLEWSDPRATYPEEAISPFLWPNGTLPISEKYEKLRDNDFRTTRCASTAWWTTRWS